MVVKVLKIEEYELPFDSLEEAQKAVDEDHEIFEHSNPVAQYAELAEDAGALPYQAIKALREIVEEAADELGPLVKGGPDQVNKALDLAKQALP
jgi:hypothetical protein